MPWFWNDSAAGPGTQMTDAVTVFLNGNTDAPVAQMQRTGIG